MILQALVQHYDHLTDDEAQDIAAYGYSQQNISFCVVLNPDGTLHAIEPLIDETSGKPRPVQLIVPGQAKPSGSGLNPCLLWDNAAYLLGFVPEDAGDKKAARALESASAFRDKHLALRSIVDDAHFDAVCTFLQQWNLSQLTVDSAEIFTRPGFGVFRLRASEVYVHDRPAVQAYWLNELEPVADPDGDAPATSSAICLVTGELGPIARLHEPKIKGVSGTQSSGAALVSFNEKAYESQGNEQGQNSPVSEAAAFKYATALNHLLADRRHRIQLGDTTCVFWAGRPDSDAPDALAQAMDNYWLSNEPSPDAQQADTHTSLSDFLQRYRQAKPDPTAADLEAAQTPFYVLGLAPNAARISVRFYLQCTVSDLARRLGDHVERTAIFDSRTQAIAQPTLRELLRETGREAKDIPPQLAGDLTRSILLGFKYPQTLAVASLRRMKADQSSDQHPALNAARAAGLKAWLIRNHRQEITVALDPDRTDPAYLLGRLFAAYEKVQADSVEGKLNRTIRDSYLSSASATPAGIFPRLYRLNQHHFNKLRRDKPGLAVVREKLIGQICNPLTDFPRHLNLQEQGLFAIGYYHQTQDFYTKRDASAEDPVEAPADSSAA